MIEPQMSAPGPQGPRKAFRSPRLWSWASILVAVVFAGWYVSKTAADTAATQARLKADFEQHLAAENFEAAEKDYTAYEFTTDGWRGEARHRLDTAKTKLEQYRQVQSLLNEKRWDDAIRGLEPLGEYKDSRALRDQANYSAAQQAMAMKEWSSALTYLGRLPPQYQDAVALKEKAATELTAWAYAEGMAAKAKGDYALAETRFVAAKEAGAKAPADLDRQLATVRDLKAKADAAARLKTIRDRMNYYTSTPVRLAVGNAEFRSSVGNHYAQGKSTFVLVDVSVKNEAGSSEHANPNNFKLSTPDGYTVPHHTETYGLSNYFNAVDLGQGQSVAGWLVFYLPKADTYTLQYQGFRSSASKEIAPE